MRFKCAWWTLAAACLLAVHCSSDITSNRSSSGRANSVMPIDAGPVPTRNPAGDGAGSPIAATPPAGMSAAPPSMPPPPSTVDLDGDGFSPATGDCEDGSAQINPGAYDFPGDGHDEDCSGSDATPAEDACDGAVALDSSDPNDGARAMGLCRFVTEESKRWGVISAHYTKADGKERLLDPTQIGLLPSLGMVKPRQGSAMLAISSGVARAPDQPGYTDGCDNYSLDVWKAPDGYPKASPACPDAQFGDVYDPAALEVRIRTPSNAKSFAFDSNFYTYEYPNFICVQYNDFFVALLDPKPANLPDANILFDQDGNPVSVNNSLLQVCAPGMHGGKTFPCPQGTGLLEGTGFGGESSCAGGGATLPGLFGPFFGGSMPDPDASTDSGAATGWLHTTAPIQGGSIITLRFAIWDSGDGILDSLALIDNFSWSVETPVIETKAIIPE